MYMYIQNRNIHVYIGVNHANTESVCKEGWKGTNYDNML